MRELHPSNHLPARTLYLTRTAVAAVLGMLNLDDALDLHTTDVEALLDQFARAAAGQLTLNTIQTYKTGFRRALRLLSAWHAGDPSWDTTENALPNNPSARAETSFVTHIFPIRADLTTRLVLPIDLTHTEADRLTQFIQSLVLDVNRQPAATP